MVSAQAWDETILNAVTSSIAVGRSQELDVSRDGKLFEVIDAAIAFLSEPKQDDGNPVASASSKPKKSEKTHKGSGSGFYVSQDGHILTNAHVVDGCSEIAVDGEKANLVNSSSEFDLAILKTNLPAEKDSCRFLGLSGKFEF